MTVSCYIYRFSAIAIANHSGAELYGLTYDYHFMVQTSTGQWAEKKGSGDSRLFDYGQTPDTVLWDYYNKAQERYYEDYYDSEIIYFAIGD